MQSTAPKPPVLSARKLTAMVLLFMLLGGGMSGCHGHLKHIDGPGHSEDAPGQQKKH